MYRKKAQKVRILCLHAYPCYPPSIKIHCEIKRSQTSETFEKWCLGIPILIKENNTFIMFNFKFLKIILVQRYIILK